MFAILAFVAFILAALNVSLAGLNMIAVGLALLSLYFIVPVGPFRYYRNGP